MQTHRSHNAFLSPTAFYAPPRARREGAGSGFGVLHRWLQTMVRASRRRRMIAELESLDDAILRDIGIDRGEIRSIVKGFDDRELDMRPVATSDDRSWGSDGANRWTI